MHRLFVSVLLLDHASSLPDKAVSDEDLQLVRYYTQKHPSIGLCFVQSVYTKVFVMPNARSKI